MCLNAVTTAKLPKNERSGFGWKLFVVEDKNLVFVHSTLDGDDFVKRGKWLRAEHKRVYFDFSKAYYMSGFHIYKKRRYEFGFKAVRVQYRKARILGTEMGLWPKSVDVIIADEMFVPLGKKK